MTINNKLGLLRAAMKAHGVDAYIVPSSDPHQSEYFASRWKSRAWLSGFTGSMGYAVVTQAHAGVWTDSRYFLQAETELADNQFVLHKQILQGAPEHLHWLGQNLPAGSKIGVDDSLFSIDQYRGMERELHPNKMELVNIDLIDLIWKDRPKVPNTLVFEHSTHFSGKTRVEKLAQIRQKMRENVKKGSWHLVATLDDIGWTLNIRGRDVDCNPVTIAYMMIGLEKTYLFIDASKLSDELKTNLNNDTIFVKPYHQIGAFLESIPANEPVWVDSATTAQNLLAHLKKATIHYNSTISILLKATKNEIEMQHIRKVMAKDGAAMVKAWRWLDAQLKSNELVTEYDFAQTLARFRSEQPLYYGESFDAIIGYRGNGAIVHYHPDKQNSAQILPVGILLADSGGQFEDGTTDITRTVALSTPTEEQCFHYTLVLKGHIQLAMLQFPKGTRGVQMDTLARMALWQHGLNFGHGTGHGVGFFMNVHEPPQGFVSSLALRGTTVMEVGMLTSNEPGFYKTGEYGIRIENLMLAVPAVTTEYGDFLKFETVTYFPIDTTLIQRNLLEKSERKWLNDYHKMTYQKIAPLLNEEEKGWLKQKCVAI
jgi:Xaa-Pro aminopeptidase